MSMKSDGTIDLFNYRATVFQHQYPDMPLRWYAHLWHDDEPLPFAETAPTYPVMIRLVRDYFKFIKVEEHGYTISINFRMAWKHAVLKGYDGPIY
jgi:hypothetical protein